MSWEYYYIDEVAQMASINTKEASRSSFFISWPTISPEEGFCIMGTVNSNIQFSDNLTVGFQHDSRGCYLQWKGLSRNQCPDFIISCLRLRFRRKKMNMSILCVYSISSPYSSDVCPPVKLNALSALPQVKMIHCGRNGVQISFGKLNCGDVYWGQNDKLYTDQLIYLAAHWGRY